MKDLIDFIDNHTHRGSCRCGRCVDQHLNPEQPPGHTANMVFFEVSAENNPDACVLRRLVEANKQGAFCDLDPWDGKEHSYLEVGAWIGDQGFALRLMGLGYLLGLWNLRTPYTMLPKGSFDDNLALRLAERGLVAICDEQPKKTESPKGQEATSYGPK